MRPEVISEVLKADLNVYSVFSLLSTAMGSAFLCDICHQPAHPPGLLPASSAPPGKDLQTHGLYFLPCDTSYIPDLFHFSAQKC